MVAQVPIHQHTTGFVILPCLIPWQILYSSVPPICEKDVEINNGYSINHKYEGLFLPHLSEHHDHLYSRSVLVTQHVVSKHRAWVSVPTNGHTFINSISSTGDYIVEFIGHAARAGHVGHAAWTVELGGKDVIQHASCVADLKTAWLDSSNLGANKQVFSHEKRARETLRNVMEG